MRIFRNEEAARKDGLIVWPDTRSQAAYDHNEFMKGEILTDRERRLLEALEKVLPDARETAEIVYNEGDRVMNNIEAAEALIRELNVEG